MRLILLVAVLSVACVHAVAVAPKCHVTPLPAWKHIPFPSPGPDGGIYYSHDDAITLGENINALRDWSAQVAPCLQEGAQ